jgi:hypothetical protein
MTHTEPQNLGELWRLIERDSRLSREAVKRELDDVKEQLKRFVTRDHFDAEKRLLEQRVAHLEEAVRKLEREAVEEERSRRQRRRDIFYKGIIPGISLIIAGVSLITAFH